MAVTAQRKQLNPSGLLTRTKAPFKGSDLTRRHIQQIGTNTLHVPYHGSYINRCVARHSMYEQSGHFAQNLRL